MPVKGPWDDSAGSWPPEFSPPAPHSKGETWLHSCPLFSVSIMVPTCHTHIQRQHCILSAKLYPSVHLLCDYYTLYYTCGPRQEPCVCFWNTSLLLPTVTQNHAASAPQSLLELYSEHFSERLPYKEYTRTQAMALSLEMQTLLERAEISR